MTDPPMAGPHRESAASYGFHGRLRAEFPSQVIVDSTELCNLACVHCPHPQFKKSVHYQGRSLSPQLNAKLVDEVRERGQGITQYIRYTGEGEPLIHPRIFDMLDYAVRRSGVTVSLTTNGTLLDEPRAERLLGTGIDLVDVSIDASTADTYAAIRVHGDLDVTRNNVRSLLRLSRSRSSRTKVVVSYVEQPQNQHETGEFEAYWRANGADHVVIRRLHSNAGAVVPIASVLSRRATAAVRYPCLYPWERIILTPRGELGFCPQDWVRGSVLADYNTSTIAEVWQGEFYQRLREAHLTNDFHDHSFCGGCPDWSATRWPNQGSSYADMVEAFKASE
jgi:pyruvate-formate lyase-activating enzyme